MVEQHPIPRTVEEAMATLDAMLSDGAKARIDREPLRGGFYYRIGGMAMRNEWNLWGTIPDLPRDLYDYFTGLGVGDPGVVGDDISLLLSTLYWHHRRGEIIDVQARVDRLRDYYRNDKDE